MTGDNTKQELSPCNEHAIATQEEKLISAIIVACAEKHAKLDGLSKKKKAKILAERTQTANAIIKSLENTDVLKTMLATQMFEIYEQHERVSKQVMSSINYPEQYQRCINSLTKLSNVFIQQVGLMQKLMGQGQQKVMVEHVHVHNGGQAIVGNIETMPRGRGGSDEN